MDFAQNIRTIPNFPKPGIAYRDITTLLAKPDIFSAAIKAMCAPWMEASPDLVAGLDARGFIFAGAMAQHLGAGVIPVRKAGKLPFDTLSESYALEYGEAVLELHKDAVSSRQRVLIVDDLVATGGTIEAAIKLLSKLDADIIGVSALVDLPDLGGSAKFRGMGLRVETLTSFPGH